MAGHRLLDGDVTGNFVCEDLAVSKEIRKGGEVQNAEQVEIQLQTSVARLREQAPVQGNSWSELPINVRPVFHLRERPQVSMERKVDCVNPILAKECRSDFILKCGIVLI